MRIMKKSSENVTKKRKYDTTHWKLTGMMLPAAILVLLFSYLAMFGIVIAFKKFRFSGGIWGSAWCGLDNFVFLFKSDTFVRLLRNTLLYNIFWIFWTMVVQIAVAVCLTEINNKYSIKIFQSGMFIPYFLSWIVVSYFSRALFQYDTGLINTLLRSLGKQPISFYANTKWWPLILTCFHTWKGLGYGVLLYYGTMLGIDASLYEAASIDGCGFFKKLCYITLPHLKYLVLITLINSVGGIFNSDFGLFYFIPQDTGALYPVTDVFDTFVFRTLQSATNLGMSSAISFLKSVIGFILVMTTNAIVKKIDDECALI